MENNNQNSYELKFKGTGGKLFSTLIVNWILTVITLGFYYPWAKVNLLKYMYESTTFNDDEFEFKGTGKEMFIGFLKVIVLFAAFAGILYLFLISGMILVGIIVFYLCFIAVIPLAIHGSYRYRLSRSSWRGIRFRYDGNRNIFILSFFKWIFFTIISLGIYGPWFTMNIRNYVVNNIRLGSLRFVYNGNGFDYFILILKGYLLSIITLGIYSFWWIKDLFAFSIENLSMEHEGKKINLRSTMTAGDVFKLIISSYLMLIFTLGIAYAWVVTRALRIVYSKIEMQGDINLDHLVQQADDYNDAAGDDMSDFLNLDLII
jgi:uncharacterized membrane protein YjgN (DUF898 family)